MQKGESKQFIILIVEPLKLGKYMMAERTMEELMRQEDMKPGNMKQEHTQHKIQTRARSMQLPLIQMTMNLQLTSKDSKLIDRRKCTILSRPRYPSTKVKSKSQIHTGATLLIKIRAIKGAKTPQN